MTRNACDNSGKRGHSILRRLRDQSSEGATRTIGGRLEVIELGVVANECNEPLFRVQPQHFPAPINPEMLNRVSVTEVP